MTEHDALRERLFALDTSDHVREERYRARVAALVNYELTPGGRWSFRAGVALAAFGTLFGGIPALVAPVDLPLRLALATYALANVAMGVLLLRILRRGQFRIATDAIGMAAVATVGAVVVTVLFAIRSAAHPGPASAIWIAVGLLCVIVDVAGMLWAKLTRPELGLREQLIRLECQLADLADRLPRPAPSPDAGR